MTDKTVAITILKQLGGKRFMVMTGAKGFLALDDGMAFSIPKGANGIRRIKITLNSMDLYDMEFYSLSGKSLKKVNNVYNDQLQDIFTAETGLYTHL